MRNKGTLFYGARVYLNGAFRRMDLEASLFFNDAGSAVSLLKENVNCENYIIVPGFADVHVHLREPGFSFKETIKTGTSAAARGGYTYVCAMPNVNPPPGSLENLGKMLEIVERDALIKVIPYGSITANQSGAGGLSDMEALAPYVCGFSDDGRGVQSGELMERAMLRAKSLGLPIVAHCEDESLLIKGGCVHDGSFARENGLTGISSQSEWEQLERDISLVRKTGCAYHVCHISTKESVEIVRQAKLEGLPVTCETAPHYLIFCDGDLRDDGKFKMNPPIRSNSDREALIEGLRDGTIDIIATDHAPHTVKEKSGGLRDSLFGIVGLETAFPVLYTRLVKEGIITLEKLVELMALRPREIFRLGGCFPEGKLSDFTVIDLGKKYRISADSFLSKGRSTPFEGMDVYGETVMTVCGGKIVYERDDCANDK